MNPDPIAWAMLARLAGAPVAVVLVAKWTALLGLAWMAHRALAGRNPRWRVMLWRGAIAGVGLVVALSCVPPVVRWPVAPDVRPIAVALPRPPVPVVASRSIPLVSAVPEVPIEPDRPARFASDPPVMAPGPVAPADRVATGRPWEFGPWLVMAWAIGSIALAARLFLAARRLSAIVRRSSEAPEGVVREFLDVAGRLGGTRGVIVRRSSEVNTPCLAGVFRPVLLLPDLPDGAFGRADLRAILAHELAHARGHDLAWNLGAHLASIGLWFHPLAWRIRDAHASACDAVCDAVAADQLGDVKSYSRTLARLALNVEGPPPATGLAMARSSDVGRRIRALDRHLFRTPPPRRLVMAASSLASLMAVLIGGLAITRAEPSTASPEDPEKPAAARAEAPKPGGRMEITAAQAATGGPLEGVSIFFQGRFDGKMRQGTVVTGKDGKAVVEWPAASKVEYLKLFTTKAKFVPIYKDWRDDKRPIELPGSLELRYEAGTTIGGIVKDEAGRPIAGAKVSVSAPVKEKDNFQHWLGFPKTDAEGRWRLDEAPGVLAGVSVRVEHPDYRPGWAEASRDLAAVSVLKKGLSVTGRILDLEGKPIAGASAVIGHDVWGSDPPTARADASGVFTLNNCPEGPSVVTVQAPGFAPELRDVRVGDGSEPIEFRLGPSATLRIRVVDRDGKPVVGAFFAADTWRGHRSIQFRANTDAEGRIVWKDAPKDVVLCDMGTAGLMARRRVPLTASDSEQAITLDPELVISGRVTEASTGKPIPEFRIVMGNRFEGQERIYWYRGEGSMYADGKYTFKLTEPSAAYFVRVEAIGYRPVDSRAIRSDEGRQSIDFALDRTDALSGIVLAPDGRPAAGVEVAMATRETSVSLSMGGFGRNNNVPIVKTGADGRFAFAPPGDKFLLVALGDAGFADAPSDEFAKTGQVALRPWGRIEGRVKIGRKPWAGQPVSFQPTRPDRSGGIYVFDYGYNTRTDEQGRFAFDRAVPGPGIVSRVVVTEFAGGSSQHMPCWSEAVEVKAGEPVSVTIGGKGRAVVGRVVLDGTPDAPVDWRQNEPATINLPRSEWGTGQQAYRRYAANIDKEGRFRIEDVPPGKFELTVPVNAVPDPRSCGSGTAIGRAIRPVTVPDGPGDDPVDLGEFTATLFETLRVGDLAPDFTARRLDGGSLKLRDLRGKLVLLDFWATWCGPCLAEMPAIQGIRESFKDDPRFVLVALSCDQSPEIAAEYVRKNGLGGTQAFAGSLQAGVASGYKVRAIPSTFLVGPDGRILAKNLRGDDLKRAVRAALDNAASFSAAREATRPTRFPVKRFDAGKPAGSPVGEPSVIVLDDSDADFQADRPHRDGLRILTDSGQEIAATKGFNTCQSVGGIHGVAVDLARGRIYLSEQAANRIVALDLGGRKIWQIEGIEAGALAVDPRTGNVWCTVGKNLAEGETVVLDADGAEVDSFPVRGIDIAYDPKTDAFWLVGYGVVKLGRDGKELFRKPKEGWACVSIAADPNDGSVWIVERSHPDVARSENRLWHLDASGELRKVWSLGEKDVFGVAFSQKADTAWVACLGSDLLRFTSGGLELPPLPIPARSIAVGQANGQVWAATETELVRIGQDGRIEARSPLEKPSGQSWLAAF